MSVNQLSLLQNIQRLLDDYVAQAQWQQAAILLTANLLSDLPLVLHSQPDAWLARFPTDAFDANS